MNRQMTFLFLVAACLWQAATGFAAPQIDKSQADAITEISLQRTPSEWGQRPEDVIILRADGTAVYIGMRNVERIGRFNGVFPKANFTFLKGFLMEQYFFELKNNSIYMTDVPISNISVVRGDKRNGIDNYGNYGTGYPLTIWGIEMAIRGVAADIKWKKVEPKSDAKKMKANLRGVAMAGPVNPVEREGEPNEKPLAGAVITIQPDGGGKEIIRKRADKEGRFEFVLNPGTYLLVPLGPQASDKAPEEAEPNGKNKKKWMLPRGEPQTIIVEQGKVTEVVIHYDTGIR